MEVYNVIFDFVGKALEFNSKGVVSTMTAVNAVQAAKALLPMELILLGIETVLILLQP